MFASHARSARVLAFSIIQRWSAHCVRETRCAAEPASCEGENMEQRAHNLFLMAIAIGLLISAFSPTATHAQESGEPETAEVDGLRLVEITLARNYEAGQAI